MAFFNKLNDLAKNIGDRTNDAIETGKLTAKIHTERNAASEDLKKIGEHYYHIFAAGGEVPEELAEIFQSAKAHFEAAEAAQLEIDRIKAENAAEKASSKEANEAEAGPGVAAAVAAAVPAEAPADGISCPNCNTINPDGTKFCRECGTKLEIPAPEPTPEPAPEPEPAVPEKRFCTNCGTEASGDTRFCSECGTKLD